jgi:glycosyltransferase involved in cell wall biosynthesis
MTNTVSAVIPTFNRRRYVGRAIASVLRQRRPPDEIVVVDDGSTDGTADYVRAEFGDSVRVVEQLNGGVSAARRRGVLEAGSEWIAFLDSDDEWLPARSEAFHLALPSLPPEVCWVFGDTMVADDRGDRGSLFRHTGLSLNRSPTVFDRALDVVYPLQYSLLQSSLVRRTELIGSDAFSENLRSSEDFLVSFRSALRGSFAAVPDMVTRLYRTEDLAESSLDRSGKTSVDYFKARVIAFDEGASRLGARPWGRLHAQAVRGCCFALAREGRAARGLPLQQFRHGVTAKSLAFTVASAFGPWPLRVWDSNCGSRSWTSDSPFQL